MGERFRVNWGILAATFFSAVLIVGAFVYAQGFDFSPSVQASEETALLQVIATKDSDSDGLPDWEEALYGTDPKNSDSFKLGMTDGEAVAKGLIVPKAIADMPIATSSQNGAQIVDPSLPPAPTGGTLTAAFAQNFFTAFTAAKEANSGGDLTESQMNDVTNQALSSISDLIKAAPDFKAAKDLAVSDSGADAMTSFAVNAEAILLKNTANATTSEIVYLKNALTGGDETALSRIASIAKAYRDSAVGIAILPVPRELAAVDLALLNALMRVSQISSDFARANVDPLATILALGQYPQATDALGKAFVDIGQVYADAGISLPNGAPGASFVNLIANAKNKQSKGL
ncbi:MAG: thrombospondin type 3 repeat-containing protein [Minisyncoccia bacterium]